MERMLPADKASFLPRSLTLAALLLVGATSHAGHAATSDRPGPRAGSCSESCDRKAADCLDGCESKYKDDKQRVECKLQCASDRQKCEAACPP